jgi:hypothetical protein
VVHAGSFAARPSVIAVEADWGLADFRTQVERPLKGLPLQAALLWLHDPEPVLEWLLPLLDAVRTVLVLGSTHGAPAIPGQAAGLTIVRLGRIGTKDKWRWLTDGEISQGAIAALRDGVSRDIGAV